MNKAPKFLKTILLLLVAAGIGAWAWKTFGPAANTADQQKQPTPAAAQTPAEEPARLVVVTYFTSDQRCPTCLKIEKQTREAVEGGFGKELADGVLRFQTLNMDRAENKHFVGDYGLSFKTVVISERKNGKQTTWEKFDEVWDLVGDPEAFSAYIRGGIRKHLKAAIPAEPKPEATTTDNPFSDA
jgi:hypothetical protein